MLLLRAIRGCGLRAPDVASGFCPSQCPSASGRRRGDDASAVRRTSRGAQSLAKLSRHVARIVDGATRAGAGGLERTVRLGGLQRRHSNGVASAGASPGSRATDPSGNSGSRGARRPCAGPRNWGKIRRGEPRPACRAHEPDGDNCQPIEPNALHLTAANLVSKNPAREPILAGKDVRSFDLRLGSDRRTRLS